MPSITKRAWTLALVASSALCTTNAFQCPSSPTTRRTHSTSLHAYTDDDNEQTTTSDRRTFVHDFVINAGLLATTITTTTPLPAHALIEGNVPPTKTKSLSEEYRQGSAALGSSVEAEVLPRESYKKLPSGVIYADISVPNGGGEEVKEGSKLNVQWVLRRSNGYFVDSSAVSDSVPFIFTVGDPKGAIAGVDEGVRGMKAGGTRRLLIPPRLAYMEGLDDGKPGPIPAGFGPRQQMRRVMEVRKDVPGEYIFLEVKVSRIR
mmetsp:Transcript_36066/g.66922  ORF Transcript_36066/g.66922 Transcript_36066/m.66922 type:complete len:262 (-) Transcript_36066:45-830(-)|eukprot:CAMPEP_0196143022 /NCGR_PEP_ID=MMETSP0910-20130528/12571_1 /TAXON_ID=49265 /ORGANISM="Thalassiosira rotula, Strain GSO102" /LENGTH=261 /DNA_ID=CAMNT_0041404407 /DNA_START=60 /DNA_END=845 /DNA_ORIENTATION=-